MDSLTIVEIIDALIDTAERTTDLEGVYDDRSGMFFSWSKVYKMQQIMLDELYQQRYNERLTDEESL